MRLRGCWPRSTGWALTLPLLLLNPRGMPPLHLPPNTDSMMRDVAHLASSIGPRVAGSAEERRAAAYIESRFRKLGHPVRMQEFTLPDGRRSANVIAGHPDKPYRLVVGGHYDSRPKAPGADDNASGAAVLLELARQIPGAHHDILFVAFGSEERIDHNRSHHHYGSRHFVQAAPPESLKGLDGMLCIDCVGNGPRFYAQGMRNDQGKLAWRCRYVARQHGIAAAGGWASPLSDHAAFARAGVPIVAYRRSPHPLTHTPRDTTATIRPEYLRETAVAVSLAIDAICNRP